VTSYWRYSSLSVVASYLIDRSGSRPVCYDVEPESDRKARPNHHDKQHAEAHGAQAPRARSGSRRWATIGGDRGRTKLERPANGLRRGQGGPVRSEPPFRLSDANLRLGAEPLIEMTTPPWVWPCRPLRSSSRVPGGSPPSTPTVALAPPDARAAWSRRRWSRCHSGPAAGAGDSQCFNALLATGPGRFPEAA